MFSSHDSSVCSCHGDFQSVKQADSFVLSLNSILVMSEQDSALYFI